MDNHYINNNIVEALKLLKEQIYNGKVSVLIGSGFSKNVSGNFPDWTELLEDMACELYDDEINLQIRNTDRSINTNDEDGVQRREYGRKIIKKVGYVELIAEYQNRKGFRESIDAYIEEHIPIIKKESEHYILKYLHKAKRNDAVITSNSLDLHRKLLTLNWNNIFTTNYDNCIEIAYTDKQNELHKVKGHIKDLERSIENNYNKIEEQKSIINEKELAQIQRDEYEEIPLSIGGDSANSAGEEIKKLEIENDRFKFELKQLRRKIEAENINVVKRSSDLQIQKIRNIVKLHGSIPKDKNDRFEFDSDIHKRYVISKQDYEDYPQKHEAFTQLMRISLLQDSFCLIGFSGVDPNFIAWISWVRDIIERKTNGKQNQDYKIYLIDVNAEVITPEKELFYRNHRIVQIPICSEEILKILEQDSKGSIDRTNKSQVLELLFSFLSSDSNIDYYKSKEDEYKVLYELISKGTFDKEYDLGKLKESINKLWRLNNITQVGIKDELVDRTMLTFLQNFDSLYDKFFSSNQIGNFCQLLLIVLGDSNIPLSQEILNDKTYNELIENVQTGFYAKNINILKLHENVLLNNKKEFDIQFEHLDLPGIEDAVKYEKALLLLFNLKFTELQRYLAKWNPRSYFIVLKANLLAHHDLNGAFEYLKKFIYESTEFSLLSPQEKLFAYQFLYFLNFSIFYRKDEKIWNSIEQLRKQGLKNLNETIESFRKNITPKISRIEPHNIGAIEINHDKRVVNEFVYGIQFMQFLINSGLSPESMKFRLIEYDDWYNFFKIVYQRFPNPSLYYSLQYQSAGFTKRVGQDYINSEILHPKLHEIFENVSLAWECENTPIKIKDNILYFITELIVALKPEVWENFFMSVWKKLLEDGRLFDDTMFHVHDFVKRGLKFLEGDKNIEFIIISLLENLPKGRYVINYLYALATSKTIDRTKAYLLESPVVAKIHEIIENLNNDNLKYSIYALGNLEKIITTSQKKSIQIRLNDVCFDQLYSPNIWHVILSLSQGNKEINLKTRKAILQNKYLFDSGITINEDGRKSISPNDFIELHRLRKSIYRPNGLEWTKEESGFIFKKLCVELDKIDGLTEQGRAFWGYKDIIEEMKIFLIDEQDALKNYTDYNDCLECVQENLSIEVGSGSIEKRIMSENQKEYFHAMEELTKHLFEMESVGSYAEIIDYVLSKLLVGFEPNLLFTLRKVSIWVKELKDNNCMNQFSDKLCFILDKYQTNYKIEGYKPAFHLFLVTIAEVLKYWDIEDDAVRFWLGVKNNSIFNNVRQFELN
ncbi:SIR2 family protein [Draconibacterium sediminis]|uniref:SIR2 family protein n=1 Tax=Draconibacterium sediminis TaxID=1544798 RepID=UPI0026EAD98E|nr:SIR2 family protein [Draconibacterium sediminis]